MSMTTISEREAEVAFVKEAAAAFAENPRMYSYGKLQPGELIALRWGLHQRAVKLLRLHEDFSPVIYADAVPATPSEPAR
jgi:hypothetical protein